MLAELLIFVFCCYFIYSTWNTMYRRKNLPPGPKPLPLIGNLLQIEKGAMVNSLMKLWKQYGPVYTLYFGSKPVIMICGYEAVKEALVDNNDVFGGRGTVPTAELFTQGYGIVFSRGERWKQMRTFTFKTLKDFGYGKKDTELMIQEEARRLVEEFRKFKGQSINPTKHLTNAFVNILCSVLFGDQYNSRDEEITKFVKIIEEVFKILSSPWAQLHNVLPTLLDYIPGPHHKIISIIDDFIETAGKIVKSCQKTLDPNKPRHFVDCFLIKIEKEKDDPNTNYNVKNLLYVLQSVFMGAADTVSVTIRHGLLVLLKYPEIEDKLHEEIDRVIGRDRIANWDDRLDMPYTQAVLHEVQRFSDIGPLNIAHMVMKDIEFRGYFLPKGTEVYPLLCTVHRDPTQYATPYKFNPNHFLDENGQVKKIITSMPFSAGKRVCPGENVARMEFFIFFTAILQNFRLSSETKFTEADIAPKLAGFLNAPIQFELSFIPR